MGLHVLIEHALPSKLLVTQIALEWFFVCRVSQFVDQKFVLEQKTLFADKTLEFKFTFERMFFRKYYIIAVLFYFFVTQMFASRMLPQSTEALELEVTLGAGHLLRIVRSLV